MATYWTLKHFPTVGSPVEKSLAGWGFTADFAFTKQNKSKHTFSVRTTERFDSSTALLFAFQTKVIIYRDRVSSTGLPGSFSGGTIYMQGYVDGVQRAVRGASESVLYKFHNFWWFLERHPFKQTFNVFSQYTTPGDINTPPLFVEQILSEVYLGEQFDGSYQNNGQQVEEVIEWLNECFNPTRQGAEAGMDASQDVVMAGAIGVAVNIPKSRLNDIFCSEAVVNVLRWSPDAVIAVDYTTTIPTLNVTSLASMPVVTLDITEEQERQIKLAPQNARVLPGVIIHYKRTDTVDGAPWPQVYTDKYPPSVNEYTPLAVTKTIELEGANTTNTTAAVRTSNISNAQSATASVRKSFWLQRFQPFNDPLVHNPALGVQNNIVVTVASVVDDNGNAVNTATYPRILEEGQLADWMGVNAIVATVKAVASYHRYQTSSHVVGTETAKVVSKEIQVRVVLTNATTRVYHTSNTTPGDPVPTGVAQAIYTSVSTLQHEGSITLNGAQLRQDIDIGMKLTLVGPNNTFANLVVQGIEEEPHWGRTTVTFGPSSVLDASDLIELARVNRFRTLYGLPSNRASGSVSAISLGNSTPKENSTHAEGSKTMATSTHDTGSSDEVNTIQNDAENQRVVMIVVNKVTGAEVVTKPKATMALGDLVVPVGQPRPEAKFQPFTDTTGKTQYVFATAPVSGGAGGGYRGVYASASSYPAGSIVTVLVGSNAGTWGASRDILPLEAPVFPQPVGAAWHLLALGVNIANTCTNGVNNFVYVNASGPI